MRLLRWFDATTRAPGFGDRAVLAIAVVVVALSFWLEPGADAVSFLGWDVPVLCTFRRLTGLPCPGCGLTRSFVFVAHGHLSAAMQVNLLGPAAFALTAAQIPYRLHRLWQRHVRAAAAGEVTDRRGEGAW